MATLGIICPLKVEAEPLLKWNTNPQTYRYKERTWAKLELGSHTVILVVSKIGKRNTEVATKALIAEHRPQIMINFGSAGAISPQIKVGEIVVANATAEYLRKAPYCNLALVSEGLLQPARSFPQIRIGPIVSANKIINNESMKLKLYERYQALCGDWESGVFMRVCQEAKVPGVPFRVVTDLGNAKAIADFMKNHKKALALASQTLKAYLGHLETGLWPG
ncbi:5'-methylthioadenosine/S-adenosylhomocysteine nucleosidase [Deltaproteobacteria bacterium TL4]